MSRQDRIRLVPLLLLGATALCAQCEPTPRGAVLCAAILLLAASGIGLAGVLFVFDAARK